MVEVLTCLCRNESWIANRLGLRCSNCGEVVLWSEMLLFGIKGVNDDMEQEHDAKEEEDDEG